MDKPIFNLLEQESPLVMSIPHLGAHIPMDIQKKMDPKAMQSADTDWHLNRLYDFAEDLGFTIISANYSRYVIDLNRAPDGISLYPGANVTELVPTTDFEENSLYTTGNMPDHMVVNTRIKDYWQPYHDMLRSQIQRLRERHTHVVLFDCHSIRSEVPRFFEGILADVNFGFNDGKSCAVSLQNALTRVGKNYPHFSQVADGRFKGGYITREYGKPDEGIHSFQIELSQATYMDETKNPALWHDEKSNNIKPFLYDILQESSVWAKHQNW